MSNDCTVSAQDAAFMDAEALTEIATPTRFCTRCGEEFLNFEPSDFLCGECQYAAKSVRPHHPDPLADLRAIAIALLDDRYSLQDGAACCALFRRPIIATGDRAKLEFLCAQIRSQIDRCQASTD